ncbi:hypothetical protein DMUE_5020 [Dictyocoela muelleri]|nr:hypothetical protein DMUE_5020 [Dictyocoela muelleri]
MGRIKGQNIPLVYILMKKRSKECYIKAFNFINKKIIKKPEFIIIDFEMAAYVALKELYLYSEITGCFFHFSEILFRKVQKLGLVNQYKTKNYFRECFRMILALAFVPKNKLPYEISKIENYILKNDDLNDILILWNDFKKNYCQDVFDFEKKNSIFSSDFWSVVSRIKANIPKTTNGLEGWHRSLNNNFLNPHPNIYELGEELKKQHASVENKLNKLFIIGKEEIYDNDELLKEMINMIHFQEFNF